MTILTDVKTMCGVYDGNLGFDKELLLIVNSLGSTLTQMGLTEYDSLKIDQNTPWPELANETLEGLTKQYLGMRTRKLFDPIASETIARSFNESISELEGRIAHEIEESTPAV